MARQISPRYDSTLATLHDLLARSVREIGREMKDIHLEYSRDADRWQGLTPDEPINIVDLRDILELSQHIVNETQEAIRLLKTIRHLTTVVLDAPVVTQPAAPTEENAHDGPP